MLGKLVLRGYFRLAAIRELKKGQSMTEYALIIALVAIVLIGVIIALRDKIVELIQTFIDSLN